MSEQQIKELLDGSNIKQIVFALCSENVSMYIFVHVAQDCDRQMEDKRRHMEAQMR